MGEVERFLNTLLPSGWDDMGVAERRAWYHHRERGSLLGTQPREYVCAAEIVKEMLQLDASKAYDSRRIAAIVARVPGWEYAGRAATRRFKSYGPQHYYRRTVPLVPVGAYNPELKIIGGGDDAAPDDVPGINPEDPSKDEF